jgi:hypothetical protein
MTSHVLRSSVRVFLASACLCAITSDIAAQAAPAQTADADSLERSDWSVGGSFGLPGYRSSTDPSLFIAGVQFSRFRPNSLSPEFAVGTMPRALFSGILAVGVRAGAVLPVIASDELAVLPTAGVSMLAGAGSGLGGVIGGFGGISLLLGSIDESAFRAGVTLHQFADIDGPVWLFEVGFTGPRRQGGDGG